MARGKKPPRNDKPDYNPEPPPRDEMGEQSQQVNGYEPPRNRNSVGVTVIVTVVVMLILAVLYFLFRG